MAPASGRLVDASGDPPCPQALEQAASALRSGLVVGIPTDTVYGLAVDPSRSGAVDRLFALKARPGSVALPVLVADVDQARGLAVCTPAAEALMAAWWPGGLTLVLASLPGLGLSLGGDGATIGLRCPAHPVPVALARMVGPIATTSANLHGSAPVETAEALSAQLGEGVAVILDAGPCTGPSSTVVDCTGPELRCLREGSIAWVRVPGVHL
ncbi:MAG: L-threonylcarbamoyladenylate synthase [Acidimicrobiales bacterium]